MASETSGRPAGYHTITPSLAVRGAVEALEFYARAFEAREVCRMNCPQSGAIMHAEFEIGDSRIFLCEEFPDMGAKSPETLGGSPVTIHLYTEDVDALVQQAAEAGATVVMPPADMFWGDRFAKLIDPYGHHWSVATHQEDLTPEQMNERMLEWMAAMAK